MRLGVSLALEGPDPVPGNAYSAGMATVERVGFDDAVVTVFDFSEAHMAEVRALFHAS